MRCCVCDGSAFWGLLGSVGMAWFWIGYTRGYHTQA